MANQPTARPLFRFVSMARPAPPPAPTPEAQPPTTTTQPRPPLMRTTFTTSFRPPTTQPQEPAPPAPPPPPPVSAPPPPPISAPAPPPSTSLPAAAAVTGITTSVPSSPIGKNSIAPDSPSSTRIPVSSSSSVPPSPKPKIAAYTAPPFPNSPVPKILSTTSSAQPNSPATKISAPISSVPTSPAPKIPSLQPTSPSPKAAPTSFFFQNSPPPPKTPISTTAAANAAIPPQLPTPSPKLTKQPLAQTPPQSEGENGPRIPLEAEQKTVLVQKTIDKPKPSWFNGDSQKDAHKPRIFRWGTNEKGSHNKKNFDPEEIGMSVITISGENRGAFMELSHAHKKHGHFEGNPHSLIKKNGNESDSSSNGEGKSKTKDQNHKKMATVSPPVNAFVNSNVQGINNSIVFNSSGTHHDPGVHLSLSRKPNGGHKKFQFKDNATDYYHS